MIEFLILDMGFDWFNGCGCRMGRGKASRVKTIKSNVYSECRGR